MGQQASKPDDDILFYLKSITNEDKEKLFDLIAADQESHAIQLTCELINRQRRGPRHVFGLLHIPEEQCVAYGHYIYNLLKDAYWHRVQTSSTRSNRPSVRPSPFVFTFSK